MANSSKYFRDTVACAVEMFSENMQVFVYTNNKIQMTKINSENAGATLVGICKEYDIDLIQLSGDSTYLEDFISTIRDAEELEYGVRGGIEIQIIK